MSGELVVHRHLVRSVLTGLLLLQKEYRRDRTPWPQALQELIADAELAESEPMVEQMLAEEVPTVDETGSDPVEWITADGAASRLGCSSEFVRRLCRCQDLRAERTGPGGVWRIDAASVEARAQRLNDRRAA